MKEDDIIDLYWRRDDQAVTVTDRQFGRYCYSIAYNILNNREDSDECVNDTWLKAWNSIPPQRPVKLSLFLGKITRNLSFDRFKTGRAQKRGGGEIVLVLEELEECIPSSHSAEQAVLDKELDIIINTFLHSLPARECNIFLNRYWYSKSIKVIAEQFKMKENNVKASLFRSRIKLKAHLEKEDIYL